MFRNVLQTGWAEKFHKYNTIVKAGVYGALPDWDEVTLWDTASRGLFLDAVALKHASH